MDAGAISLLYLKPLHMGARGQWGHSSMGGHVYSLGITYFKMRLAEMIYI